ncbi:MAG: hypothetical protein ISR69_07775 [Gammaproteobacteria bacterium]|nr:hypothetical protein [Gammaproteobacteria bacterium]
MNVSDDRKVHSTDIVNGLARKDIFDSKGVLLVKKDARISEAHYARMREEGLVIEENTKSHEAKSFDINYVSSKSLHGRLEKVSNKFIVLQEKIVNDVSIALKQDFDDIVTELIELCDEDINQVLGELFLYDLKKYFYSKPIYIAASLIELIKRFNVYKKQKVIKDDTKVQLVQAALTYNIGLIQCNKELYDTKKKLTVTEKRELRENYPTQSITTIIQMGIADPVTLDAIKNHNIAAKTPSFEALLLRTPFIYAGIALPENKAILENNLYNPCREFAKLFSESKLDPVLGGLFLKINGIAPIGSILNFETREKGVVIRGPSSSNVMSSLIRIITNKTGVQLRKPGEKFYLHQTKMLQKGLSDHHQFAWSKFSPFVTWER